MPAGMIQVAIAAITISANRIVYAEGSVKRRFCSGSVGGAAASVMWCLLRADVPVCDPPGASSGSAPSAAGGMVATLKPRYP